MPSRGRVSALAATVLVIACLLTSCGSSPTAGRKKAVRHILTTTTAAPTTTSTAPTSTPTAPGVAVPNVIGEKIAAARGALRAANLPSIALNTPCNKGTLASQSVAAALSRPGKAPDVRVGAVPLQPGTVVPSGTRVGITWSGCYGDASAVPTVVGLTLAAARHALHAVGLTWACYSVGQATTTTSTKATTTSTRATTTSTPASSTTTSAVTTTTARTPQTVLTQTPAAHTVVRPGATVSLTMQRCPQ
jgi:beta-lactam-binding protein with PASTA domain